MSRYLRYWIAALLVWVATVAARTAEVRIVSQTVGTDEMLLAVAAPEQIAALSHYARDPQFSGVAREAAAYPALDFGDVETILRYRPTLVLLGDYSRPELVEQVRRAGVPVFMLNRYRTLEEAFDSLRQLAVAIGGDAAKARAEAVIIDCRQRVDALRDRLKGVPLVRVIAPSTYGVIPGGETTFQDICDFAGADNLALTLGHLEGHAPPPNEAMLAWPIERVVLGGSNVDDAIAPFLKLPPYAAMPAVRNRRVALLDFWAFSCVSHLRVHAYEQLARQLHPERFKD
ncbi:MAG: ABC transporter substrate-binding protein [Opitutaceae bacterium]|nr:ABC transporter substrate-binding protein [Opitutaceae bacterium]